MGRTISVRCGSGRREPPRRAIGPGGHRRRNAGLAPLTRRFVVFELFAPFGAVRDRTNRFGESHFGDGRVAPRSRTDNGRSSRASTQVIPAFCEAEDFTASACCREPSHCNFVTQHTLRRTWMWVVLRRKVQCKWKTRWWRRTQVVGSLGAVRSHADRSLQSSPVSLDISTTC